MEFDKNKILTSVTADQAKVGQKGWIGSTLSDLKYSFGKEDKKITLLSIRGENVTTRFVSDKYGAELLFYPEPEPTYKERQKEWVVKNKVCIGTKVRIIRDFTPDEDDSNCIFETENVGKKKIVGEVGRVTGIYYDCILVEVHVENWRCPFTVLEVIKEPSYRPFKNAEEFKPYREKWLKMRDVIFQHDGYYDEGIIVEGERICWIDAFTYYKFEDGTPFGMKEEA
jgi:hypothetical protein